MKTAIIILSDPKTGGDEALGRVFNGLAAAFDIKQAGEEVSILFQGAGVRWVAELTRADHPAYELYQAVSDTVAGASCGCADVFGAADDVAKQGLDLIKDNPVPGTNGIASYLQLQRDGYQILNF